MPARTRIRTDDALIPLDGERAFVPVTEDERPTFETPRPVGDAVLDVAFADLVADADGLVRTRLRDPDTGRHADRLAARRADARLHRRHPGPRSAGRRSRWSRSS